MDLAILYKWRGNITGEDTRRLRALFVAWEPPVGLDLKCHYHFARGGGVMIVNAADGATLFEALSPFTPAVELDIEPVVGIAEAIAISMDVEDWTTNVLKSTRSRIEEAGGSGG